MAADLDMVYDAPNIPGIHDGALPSFTRDLVALSAMPAAWIGRSPAAIAESVRDLMVSILRPDRVYVELHDRENSRTHIATAHGKTVDLYGRNGHQLYRDVTSEPLVMDSEVALELASLPIGLEGELGRVSVGCSRPYFPSRMEMLLMQVAANQIAVALTHAELLIRHQKSESALDSARAEAERMSRLKSEFLGMMSHELRTPLNAIGGYVQLLEDGIRGPVTDDQRADLGRIRRSHALLIRIIDNVLGYLKLGSGHISYEIRDLLVDDVVSAAEVVVLPLIHGKGLEYQTQAPIGPRLFVRADSDRVQQILLNLLSNAIKFTDTGGTITIAWAPCNDGVNLSVSDTGVGIPAERLHTVFEPFVQVDSSRTRPAGGTGLGLSISRDFARGMGGNLLVESEQGRGSVFTLFLSRSGERSPASA
jgi:signal transduction histidine kinase